MEIGTRLTYAAFIGATIICLGCGAGADPQTGASVVLVTIDSLRPDMLRPWNPKARADTPNLDALASRGLVFHNAWTVTPWTAPAVVSIFSGLYPPSHGVVNRDDTSPPGLPTLTTVLDGAGYEIGDFTFLTGIPYFRNLGFPESPVTKGHAASPGKSFKTWLPTEGPFFAWFHLIEPHLPYGATGYAGTTVKINGSTGLEKAQLRAEVPFGSVEFELGDREHLIALYNEDVEAVDEVVGRIVSVLAERSLLDGTIIVITADHGEELLDHGWIGHASTAIHAKLETEVLQVPLIIAGPGVPEGKTFDGLVQHVDLLPTLCRLLGLEPPRGLDGTAVRIRDRKIRSKRRALFFTTSTGGNLTPEAERGDRLLGVSDGQCLVVRTAVTDRPPVNHTSSIRRESTCTETTAKRLILQLDDWADQQATQRLQILGAASVGTPPSLDEVSRFVEGIQITRPSARDDFSWNNTHGLIELEWTGTAEEYWIEYEIGRGLRSVAGAFTVDQPRLSVGPFPQAFWDDLATHNPYLIRIISPGEELRSRWVEFEIQSVDN